VSHTSSAFLRAGFLTSATRRGRKPEQLSADAGYCSEANLEALENRNIDAYVATGRARDAVAGPSVTISATS
jgi:hypothetical protein